MQCCIEKKKIKALRNCSERTCKRDPAFGKIIDITCADLSLYSYLNTIFFSLTKIFHNKPVILFAFS